MSGFLGVLAWFILGLFAAAAVAALIFMMLAWPVFGIREPTIGLLIGAPVVGAFYFALSRVGRP